MTPRVLNATPSKAADLERGPIRIWKMPKIEGGPVDWSASIGSALVSYPGVHAFWSRWYVGMISLAEIHGVRPAKKQFDLATHEVIFFALDPEFPVAQLETALAGGSEPISKAFLTPVDLVHQVALQNDAQAASVFEDILRAIVAGNPPDSDFRTWWRGCLDTTAKHYREGGHPESVQ
jgi:hypothetical protein